MTDPDNALRPSEATDSDELGNDDGDQVVDPPDEWQGADKFGMAEGEAAEGESLDDKLAAEEPDIGVPAQRGGKRADDESLFPVVE